MVTDFFTKTLSVIGSTGSIGTAALKIAGSLGIRVRALTAHSNLELLKRQAEEFKPDFVGVTDRSKFVEAKRLFGGKLLTGDEALSVPSEICDTALVSVVGISGLIAAEAAIKNGVRVALANKECVVAGGEILTRLLKAQNSGEEAGASGKKAEVIPVDSEHSAIFQCLKAGRENDIKRLILTASGGAFYNYSEVRLKNITPADIFHPNWRMGRKITIDSCTLMNKALEIIEAYWLFLADKIDCARASDAIEYVIHPESIIHSMVEFEDGATLAQLSIPDMSLPISYALTYPTRAQAISTFNFDNALTFVKKNPLFYAPELAFAALRVGGSAGTVLNAANEAAVALFEKRLISFADIAETVKNSLSMSDIVPINTVFDVIAVHEETVRRVMLNAQC